MEILQKLLNSAELLIPILIAFNLLMAGLHGALEKIKHLTESKLDDDADSVVVKIIAFVQGIIDLFVGNKEHKK